MRLSALSFVLLSCTALMATDRYVSPTGSGTTCSQASPCSSTTGIGLTNAGDTLHFLASATPYGCISTNRNGTQNARIRYISDTQYGAKIVCNSRQAWTNGTGANTRTADYVDIIGFDISASPTSAGCEGISSFGAFALIQGNYVHDILGNNAANCGNGGGGGIVLRNNGNPPTVAHDSVVDANIIDNIGTGNGGAGSVCPTIHGIYVASPRHTLTNNLISRACGWGIHQFHDTYQNVISGNVVINNKNGGILTSASDGFTNHDTAVIDNIVAHNGGGEYGIEERYGPTASSNVYRGNLFWGNTPASGCSNPPAGVTGCPYNFANGVRTVTGTLTNGSDTTVFVSYTGNARTGDYRLKSASPAIGAGVSGPCAAAGLTPCVPAADFLKNVWPITGARDIGAYKFSSGGVPVVNFSPSPLNFGTVPVSTASSLTATLTNTGAANLTFSPATITGTNTSSFKITSTACASPLVAGASCNYVITATPQAAGALTANLTLSDNASGSPHQLPLMVTGGQVAITPSPTSLTFGTIAPNAGGTSCSAVQTVTMTSAGNANLIMGGATFTDPNFQFGGTGTCASGQTITPGNSCTVSVKFCPTSSGAKSGNLSQASNAPTSPTLIPLTGTGGSTTATLTPATFNYGNQQVGTSSVAHAFTYTNTGTLALTITNVTVNSTSYSVTDNCPRTAGGFAPAATCTVNVVFKPVSTGTLAAVVTVTGTATQTSSVTGVGTAANITLSPTTVNFGSVLVGQNSTATTVSVTNNGTATATLGAVTTAAPFNITSNTCGASLIAGASCAVGVRFSPTAAGLASGQLSVADNAPGNPHTAALSGTGTAPSVALTPSSLNYGNQPVGTATTASNFTFTNSGTGPVSISSVGIVGTNPGDFLIGTNTCSAGPTLSDTFSSGTLDGTKWIRDTGTSPAAGPGNTGTFSTSNVSLSQGVLDLMLTQVAGSPIVSTGAEVRSVNTYGYGTYTWVARAGSTATTPTGSGTVVSGQVSGLFNYFQNNGLTAPNFTEDDFEIEGQFPTQLEMTSWSSASPVTNTETNSTQAGMGTAFHQYTFIWAPGRIDYYFDGALVSTHTTNVPSAPAFVIQNFYGTNGASFGGTATTGVTRHLYVSSFSYTPATSTLGAGASCTVGVSFKPTLAGARAATLQVIDSASGSPHTSALSGTGTSLTVGLSPTSLTFANTTVGVTTASQDITVTNTGNITLNLTSITASGDYARTTTCGSTLAPAATCTVSVTFTPTATGPRPGLITFVDNASGSPQTVSLSGTGVAPTFPIATISPSQLTFSSQVINTTSSSQAITLQNTGTATLNITSITASGDFSRTTTCGATLGTGLSCTVNVSFTPTATGTRNGAITFVDDAAGSPQAVTLTGTGVSAPAPGISFSPTTLTFASTTVGVTTAAQVVTVTNTGNATLNITSIVASGDYARTTTCGSTLAAAATCTISVTFTPTATGTRTGAIAVTDNASGSPQSIPLTGVGTAPTAPIVSLSPTSLTFPSTAVGVTSAAQVVTLTNTGNATLSITSIVATGDFARTTTCGATLGIGLSCTVSVTFTPTATGTRTGLVTITDNAAGSPHTVGLTGTGTAPAIPVASISPSSLNFNNVIINTTSAAQVVTLQNTGNGTLNISSITASGDYSRTTTCGSTLAAGASCTVSVSFTPSAIGTRNGTLSFTDNAAGSPQTVTLTGSGVPAPQPAVTLAPTSLTFVSTFVGQSSNVLDVTLTNSGDATLNIASILASGDYSRTTSCGATLAASASCLIHVTFTPTAPGTRAGLISLTDDAPGSPQTVTLSGVGVATTPAVCLNKTSVSFGNQPITTTSGPQQVIVTSCGTAPLIVSGITPTVADLEEYPDLGGVTGCPGQAVWCWEHDAGTPGSASATSSLVTSPVTRGKARKWTVTSQNGGGMRAHLFLGNPQVNRTSTAFTWHGHVRLDDNTKYNQVETDTYQTLANGNTVIFGVQCDFVVGKWEYTTNVAGVTMWNNSNLSCSRSVFPSGTYVDEILTFHRDSVGNVTYDTVTINGVTSAFVGAAGNSAFSLGFQPLGNILTNFQVNGVTALQTSDVYLDQLSITGATPPSPFAATTTCGTVQPNSTCTISTTFSPVVPGSATGQLSLASNAASSPDLINLSGFGTQTGATLTPTSVSFGTVVVGQSSAPTILTLTNTSNVPVAPTTPVLSGANTGDFTSGSCPTTLAVNASCTYGVIFKPLGAGARSATLTQGFTGISTTLSVSLSGTGQATAPAVTLTPNSIDFGSVTQGVATPVQTIQLTNSGMATLNVTSVTATGTNSGDVNFSADTCTGVAVVAGGVCTVGVSMTPGSTGARSANAHFITDAASSPDDVALAVIGLVAPAPQATFTPTSLSFGNVKTGQTSASQTVTVGNIGNANLTVSSVTLGGANPSQYAQTNNCTAVVPNTSCTVTVNFAPTVTGSKPATLVIVSNDPTNPTDTIVLSGTGKGHPKAVIGVTAIDFGSTVVGTTSGPAAFTITNTGDDTLNVSSITTTGDTFLETDTCLCCPIAPATSCSVSVQFNPQVLCGTFDPNDASVCLSNQHPGLLTVVSDADDTTQTITLQGLAIPPPPPPGPITITLGGVAKVGGNLKVGVQ